MTALVYDPRRALVAPARLAGAARRAAASPWLGRARTAAPTVLGALLVVGLVAAVGPRALVDGVTAVGPGPALAALGIGLLTTLAAAARWWLVARALDVPLRAGAAVAETYRAQFLNSVLPAGVLGDVHRAVRRGGRGARAVVLERTTGQAVVVLTCVALLAAAPSLLGSGLVAVAVVAGAGALVVAGLAAVPRLRGWLLAVLGDLRALLVRRVAPGIVLLSVAGLAGHLTLFTVAARATGVETGLVELLPLLVVSLLAMVVPIGVGGWGPREATAVLAFGAAGHGAEQGLAVAVAFGVLSLLSCLPGALVLRAPRC
jgi:uncharacterized membrane protein YbhN (UPF0104 family)